MPRRRIRGDRAFARLLKQLPEDVEQATRAQLKVTGQMLLDRALARVPVYKGKRKNVTAGALKAGLSYKVPPKRLSLKVGLVGKAINTRLFYGYMVEHGHRIGYRGHTLAKLPAVSALARPGSVKYRLISARRRRDVRVSGVAPRPFVYTLSREAIYAPFRDLWSRALRRAAAGASDD